LHSQSGIGDDYNEGIRQPAIDKDRSLHAPIDDDIDDEDDIDDDDDNPADDGDNNDNIRSSMISFPLLCGFTSSRVTKGIAARTALHHSLFVNTIIAGSTVKAAAAVGTLVPITMELPLFVPAAVFFLSFFDEGNVRRNDCNDDIQRRTSICSFVHSIPYWHRSC
jgi:hypothetical protein